MTLNTTSPDATATCGYCGLFEALPESSACHYCAGQPDLLSPRRAARVNLEKSTPPDTAGEPAAPPAEPTLEPDPPASPKPIRKGGSEVAGETRAPSSVPSVDTKATPPPRRDPLGEIPKGDGPTPQRNARSTARGLARDAGARLHRAWTGARARSLNLTNAVSTRSGQAWRVAGRAAGTILGSSKSWGTRGLAVLIQTISRITISREAVAAVVAVVAGGWVIMVTVGALMGMISSAAQATRDLGHGIRASVSGAVERAASWRDSLPTITLPRPPVTGPEVIEPPGDRAVARPSADRSSAEPEAGEPLRVEPEVVRPPVPAIQNKLPPLPPVEEPVQETVSVENWSRRLEDSVAEARIFMDRGDYMRAMRGIEELLREIRDVPTQDAAASLLDTLYLEADHVVSACDLESRNNQRRGGQGLECPEPIRRR